jgi:hypothetical protein
VNTELFARTENAHPIWVDEEEEEERETAENTRPNMRGTLLS